MFDKTQILIISFFSVYRARLETEYASFKHRVRLLIFLFFNECCDWFKRWFIFEELSESFLILILYMSFSFLFFLFFSFNSPTYCCFWHRWDASDIILANFSFGIVKYSVFIVLFSSPHTSAWHYFKTILWQALKLELICLNPINSFYKWSEYNFMYYIHFLAAQIYFLLILDFKV